MTAPTRLCVVPLLLVLFAAAATPAAAHRSGCHRWHSCPSDHGTYVCGDIGYCSQCPDDEYCEAGQPRQTVAKGKKSARAIREGKNTPGVIADILGAESRRK